jgi:hypothetical protein
VLSVDDADDSIAGGVSSRDALCVDDADDSIVLFFRRRGSPRVMELSNDDSIDGITIFFRSRGGLLA